jgi:hypothetical protein
MTWMVMLGNERERKRGYRQPWKAQLNRQHKKACSDFEYPPLSPPFPNFVISVVSLATQDLVGYHKVAIMEEEQEAMTTTQNDANVVATSTKNHKGLPTALVLAVIVTLECYLKAKGIVSDMKHSFKCVDILGDKLDEETRRELRQLVDEVSEMIPQNGSPLVKTK